MADYSKLFNYQPPKKGKIKIDADASKMEEALHFAKPDADAPSSEYPCAKILNNIATFWYRDLFGRPEPLLDQFGQPVEYHVKRGDAGVIELEAFAAPLLKALKRGIDA